jgi:hypothetical protein
MTLSFVPKLIAIFVTLVLAGPWMLTLLTDYMRRLYESFPAYDRLSQPSISDHLGPTRRLAGVFIFPLTRILACWPPRRSSTMRRCRRELPSHWHRPCLRPPIPAGSWLGFDPCVEQILIGTMMGFVLRIAFAALDVAGELIGLQMGLSFATFFRPGGRRADTGDHPVPRLAHRIVLPCHEWPSARHLPGGRELHRAADRQPALSGCISLAALVKSAAMMFSLGVLLALPLITALLVTNLALGVLSRVAPALNLFAVGFPVTMALGFIVLC